jgi:hypothetical protein
MVKAMGPFRDSRAPSRLSGPRTDAYRLNPPLIGPVLEDQDESIKYHYCLCTATIDHSTRFIDYPEINVKLGKAVLIKIDILILRKSINVT